LLAVAGFKPLISESLIDYSTNCIFAVGHLFLDFVSFSFFRKKPLVYFEAFRAGVFSLKGFYQGSLTEGEGSILITSLY
jgi:hypothetical protein